jgi:hypothetical protein
MTSRIPSIFNDPNKPLTIRDKFIKESFYGTVMECYEQGQEVTVDIVCAKCKYAHRERGCSISEEIYGDCGKLIGQYQYYK